MDSPHAVTGYCCHFQELGDNVGNDMHHSKMAALLADAAAGAERCEACAHLVSALVRLFAPAMEQNIRMMSLPSKPAELVISGSKRKTIDEDYKLRTVVSSVAKRTATTSSSHARHDGFTGTTTRGWIDTQLSDRYRASLRSFTEGWGDDYSLHLCQDATRLGKPSKDMVYSVLIKAYEDAHCACIGPPMEHQVRIISAATTTTTTTITTTTTTTTTFSRSGSACSAGQLQHEI